ncbi:TAF5-like RNA polymerase II p300/CBP-associated factor-associated factor 65 kDa subunit 5L isoform X1 [Apostichopus japonicus]|uniref:TAF5-like RNA polymerase II p300/CBP-associated factor-associated factor 65 kDa subunit 5L isoform X1 n=1 Tax=Stichopus japonicus TaxID=307972 RepID=UPI003AB687D0
MKRVNSEVIHATVLDYLKRRNYVQDQSTESFSKKHLKLTESLQEFAMRTVMQRETGARNLVSCDSCNASPGESTSQFANLATFVTGALPEYKSDIEQIISPVFVHLFLEMIYNGHKAEENSAEHWFALQKFPGSLQSVLMTSRVAA